MVLVGASFTAATTMVAVAFALVLFWLSIAR